MNLELYKALREGGSGWFQVPPRALWKLTGNDRVRYLNGQVTNDVKKLVAGRALYAAVTSAKGKIMSDCFIAATADALWIDAPLDLRETLDLRLQRYLIADDAFLEDVTGQWQLWHEFGAGTSPTAEGSLAFANPRFGLKGRDLWIAAAEPGDVPFQSPEISADIVETLRLELALAKWDVDMNEDTLPQEAGLERHGLSYTKGCYLGQETIARIKSIGHVNKSLQVLLSESEQAPAPGSDLLAADKVVGRVTSSGFSPFLQKGIALGYVQRQHAKIGERLTSGTGAVIISEPPLELSLS
jgi:tRNA-modifying protein YgfZ